MNDTATPTPKFSLCGSSPVVLGQAPIGTRVLPFYSFPPELASEVLKFSTPAEVLAISQLNTSLYAMVIDPSFWSSWVRAEPTGGRQKACTSVARYSGNLLSIPPPLRSPVYIVQTEKQSCQFTCGKVGVRLSIYAPFGWKSCEECYSARIVDVWGLHALGISAQQMVDWSKGSELRYSKKTGQRVNVRIWTRKDLEKAARRLWRIPADERNVSKPAKIAFHDVKAKLTVEIAAIDAESVMLGRHEDFRDRQT